MFNDWRTRRAVQKEIDGIYRDYAPFLKSAKDAKEADEILVERDSSLNPLLRRLEVLESVHIVDEAHRLGIEVPDADNWWKAEEGLNALGAYRIRLSEEGKVKLVKLIKEEKFKRAEQWIKLITPIIGALTGLLGVIIGLIAILRK